MKKVTYSVLLVLLVSCCMADVYLSDPVAAEQEYSGVLLARSIVDFTSQDGYVFEFKPDSQHRITLEAGRPYCLTLYYEYNENDTYMPFISGDNPLFPADSVVFSLNELQGYVHDQLDFYASSHGMWAIRYTVIPRESKEYVISIASSDISSTRSYTFSYFLNDADSDGMLDTWETFVDLDPAQDEFGISLIARYSFGDVEGGVLPDDGPHALDGVLAGSRAIPGVAGQGIEFDGDDDYVEIADSSLLDGQSELTIAFWMCPYSVETIQGILTKRISPWDASYSMFLMNNRLNIDVGNYASGERLVCDQVFEPYTWYHVALVFDASKQDSGKVSVYINGQRDGASIVESCDVIRDTESPLIIGSMYDNGVLQSRCFHGAMDDLHVFGRSLSHVEVIGLADNLDARDNDSDGVSDVWEMSNSMDPGVCEYDDRLEALFRLENYADYYGSGLNDTLDELNFLRTMHCSIGFDGSIVSGVSDNAFELDGVDDYLSAPGNLTGPLWRFSIAQWVKMESLAGIQGIMTHRKTPFEDAVCSLFFMGNKLYADVGPYEPTERLESDTVFCTGKWYHIALVFDGGLQSDQRVKLYINGKLDAAQISETCDRVESGAHPLIVGSMMDSDINYYSAHGTTGVLLDRCLHGALDEIRFYKHRALTSDEVDGLAHMFD